MPIIAAIAPLVSGASKSNPIIERVPNRPGISKTKVIKLFSTYTAPLKALARAK
jgi:hypothetical protein